MSSQLLLDKLDAVRRRQRSVAIAAGVCKTVLAALGLIAAFFLLDWLVLSRSAGNAAGDKLARAVLLLAMLGTFAYVVWRTIVQELQNHPDDDEIALRVEKGHPELRGRLISTIQLTRDEHAASSQELIEALEADTLSFTGGLTFTDIINVRVLKKVAIVAGALFLVATALGAWRSDFTKAVFARLMLTEEQYPTAARIVSATPGTRVAHGEAFIISIELDPAGVLPESASAQLRTVAGQTSELVLTRAKGAAAPGKPVVYTGTIEHVLEDLEFRPAAHDALWPRWEKLSVLQRPAVKTLTLAYHFPAYIGKPDETSSVGDIRAPIGTRVSINAVLNKPVTSARLQLRDNQQSKAPVELKLGPDKTTANLELTITEAGYYRILLHCVDGFDNANPIEYAIEAVKDRVPTVKVTFPAQDKTVTRFAHWPIRFNAHDDYGIVRGQLKYRVTAAPKEGAVSTDTDTVDEEHGPPAQSLVLEGLVQGKSQKEITGEVNFDLRPLNLAPEQRVTYWIEVDDNQEPTPNHGRSQVFTFNVVDVAVMQEMLDRDRNAVLEGIQTIRDKEKDNRDGVDQVRRAMPAAASDTTKPAPDK